MIVKGNLKLQYPSPLLALGLWLLVNEKTMRFFLHTHPQLMAIPMRVRSFASALKWEGGVSMVQGASRGIGLEFVSPDSHIMINKNSPIFLFIQFLYILFVVFFYSPFTLYSLSMLR